MEHIIVLAGKPRCRDPHLPLLAMSAPVAEFDLEHLSRDNVPAAAGVAVIDCGTATDEGLRLLTEVKAGRPDLPVILVSPIATDDIVAAAFRRGAREFFEKPVDEGRLRDMVEFLLEAKRKKAASTPDMPSVPAGGVAFTPTSVVKAPRGTAGRRTSYEQALRDFLERLRLSPELRSHVGVTPLQLMKMVQTLHVRR